MLSSGIVGACVACRSDHKVHERNSVCMVAYAGKKGAQMNLHKMLERLYGLHGAVQVDPATIPCIETSNPDALCKAPLVSV